MLPHGLGAAGGVHAQLARHVDEPRAVVAEQAVGVAVLVRDEQVEVAVLVEVEPDGADGPARIVEPQFLADAGEAAAVVAEQHVRRVAHRHEEVEVAVVVDVHPRHLPRLADGIDAQA